MMIFPLAFFRHRHARRGKLRAPQQKERTGPSNHSPSFHAGAGSNPPAPKVLSDQQIKWCRDNIPGFRAMNDQAVKARANTDEYKTRLGHLVRVK